MNMTNQHRFDQTLISCMAEKSSLSHCTQYLYNYHRIAHINTNKFYNMKLHSFTESFFNLTHNVIGLLASLWLPVTNMMSLTFNYFQTISLITDSVNFSFYKLDTFSTPPRSCWRIFFDMSWSLAGISSVLCWIYHEALLEFLTLMSEVNAISVVWEARNFIIFSKNHILCLLFLVWITVYRPNLRTTESYSQLSHTCNPASLRLQLYKHWT